MSKVGRATLGLMIITMISKILGFSRELALTYVYGATSTADAYIIASSIPGILFAAIGAALTTTFIPIFYEVENLDGRNKSLEFTNNILNIVIIISILIAILGFVFAEPLVKIFAINFEGEKLILSVKLVRIMIFGVIFIGLSNIMTGWLQIHGNFIAPGMITLPYNIFIIAGILLSSKGNILIMAIGTLIGISSQFFFQLPSAKNNGYKYKKYINIKDKNIKKMMKLIIPVFIGVGVNQLNVIIDRSLASTLGDGYITILNSANRLNTFVMGIFIATIATVIYPTLSKLSNEGESNKFIDSIKQSLNIVTLLIIPISIGAIILAEPVVKIVYQRGAFDEVSTKMTAIALICYSIGMIGFGLREILDKIFYSLQDTKTPMLNAGLSMSINIILNLMFIKYFGYVGLALATSLSAIICIILLFNSLKKKIGYFGQEEIFKTIIKSTIASVVMGIVTNFTYANISINISGNIISDVIALIITVFVGAITYGSIIILLRVKEVELIKEFILKIKSKRKK